MDASVTVVKLAKVLLHDVVGSVHKKISFFTLDLHNNRIGKKSVPIFGYSFFDFDQILAQRLSGRLVNLLVERTLKRFDRGSDFLQLLLRRCYRE